MFNLTYFQTKFPILTDPGALAVRNHLVMLGLPVPGSTVLPPVAPIVQVVRDAEVPPASLQLGLLPVAPTVQVVHAAEAPSASLQLGPSLTQFGVHNGLGGIHGGLQEVVPTLPTVIGVGDLANTQVQDFAKPFPRQEPRNLQIAPSVWNKLFVSKPQTLFNYIPVVETSSWSARASPSTSASKISVVPSTTLVTRKVSPSRTSPTSTFQVQVPGQASLQVPPFKRSGPLGVEGESVSVEELKLRSKPLVQSFAWDSLSEGTKKVYNLNWKLFSNFGFLNGVNVNNLDWDFTFVCEYLLFRIQNSGSIHSVLSARSALNFYWKLGSSEPSPTESHFVSLFIKGLSRKFKNVPQKAYPISYSDLCEIFNQTLGDSTLENLSFVNLRFVTFILTLYSSFGRYEEVSILKLSDVQKEESGFILNFYKGKSYQYGESNIGVVSNLPGLMFNPSRVFSLYLDRVALLHANSDTPSDLLFPSCRFSGLVEHSLDKPVSYNVLLKQFKLSVVEAKVDVGLSKVGLHCMRRGGVTHAVRAGAPHSIVQKCMRVKSGGMVGYYATLSGEDLNKATKLAF